MEPPPTPFFPNTRFDESLLASESVFGDVTLDDWPEAGPSRSLDLDLYLPRHEEELDLSGETVLLGRGERVLQTDGASEVRRSGLEKVQMVEVRREFSAEMRLMYSCNIQTSQPG